MSKLVDEKKRIQGTDFSSIGEEERKRMTRIADLIGGNTEPALRSQVAQEAVRTVKMLNPKLTSFEEVEIGVAMIIASICNTIHYLLENDVLEYKKG